jgi:hypothetical protein
METFLMQIGKPGERKMTNRLKKFVLFECCLMALTVMFGCGDRRAPRESNRCVTRGRVMLDGKPLLGGSVTFVAVDDPERRVTTPIRSDGSFVVSDAPVGTVRIAVETESLRSSKSKNYVSIPSKYSIWKTSPLTATIAKDASEPLVVELVAK